MAGLVPAIHEHGLTASGKWMAATRAAMTYVYVCEDKVPSCLRHHAHQPNLVAVGILEELQL